METHADNITCTTRFDCVFWAKRDSDCGKQMQKSAYKVYSGFYVTSLKFTNRKARSVDREDAVL